MSQFSPLILVFSISDNPCLNQCLLRQLLHGIFSHSVVITIFIYWHSIIKESFPSFSFHLFIYIKMDSMSISIYRFHLFSGSLFIITIIYFGGQIAPIWLIGVLKLARVILTNSPHFFKLFLSAKQDVPGLSCIFSDPVLELVISPKSASPFQQRMVFENQDLDANYVHYYWSIIASVSSRKAVLGNSCVYIPVSMSI